MASRCEPVVGMSENRKELSCRSSTREAGEVPEVSIAWVEDERVLGFGRALLLGTWILNEVAKIRLKVVLKIYNVERGNIMMRPFQPIDVYEP